MPRVQDQLAQSILIMNDNLSPSDGANVPRAPLPPAGKEVLVKHNGCDRIAYRDIDGKWREFHDGSVLLGDVEIVKLD